MKKWMTLLLCGLLCLFVAGAMAEKTGELDLSNRNEIDIHPNGYKEKGKDFVPYTGTYTVTGTSNGVDTCLDFYSKPYQSGSPVQPVTYEVVFQDVEITAGTWDTAIRFGKGEQNGADISLNLTNIGTSRVQSGQNHPVFSNQFSISNRKSVTVNIHNTVSSSLSLQGGSEGNNTTDPKEWGVAGEGVTVRIGADTTIDNSNNEKSYSITVSHCALGDEHSAVSPTCTTEGNVAYQQCSICETYAISFNGVKTSVLPESVFLPIQHDLEKVERKEPTCTEDGHIEHWKCTRENCRRLFNDANGTKELAADDVRLPAQHNLVKVEREEPTYEQEGNIEHYRCTRAGCNKLFSDANGTKELTEDEVVLPKLVRTDGLPHTGDSSHLLRWMAVLLGACFGVIAARSRRKV